MINETFGGRYKVLSAIGSGGMQHVYRATDQLRGVDVALKTPQQGQAHKKFLNSAIIAARINHHNVAKTLDYFEENGRPYLAEELVEGGTLDSCIEEFGFFDPHTSARLFRLLSRALAASHHAGVVHRDLKPSNIVVSGGYSLDSVKVTDFGIATLTEEIFDQEIAERGDITKTTSGTVKGALPYMAPEMMFRKKGDFVGQKADIWSLGAMMFHIITGKLPFDEGLIVPANVKTGNREPWPAFMTASLPFKNLSQSLQEIVESCLQIDPNLRPTADELVSACNDLVYYHGHWESGIVNNMPAHTFGFITGPSGTSFFHTDSLYGPNRVAIGCKVVYSFSPGTPRNRAFPVLICPSP